MHQGMGSEGVRIVTERLVLRDFIEGDWSDACAYRSDPEVARFMFAFEAEGPEQTRVWLDRVIAQARGQQPTRRTLAIVLQSEGRVIGQIGIGPSADDFPAEGEIGIGYMLHRACWGQGYASEAARAIVELGFEVMGARQVSAWCFEGNRASAR